MRILSSIFAILLASGCSLHSQDRKTLVLEYADFGPQVIAHEVIGMNWWQWDQHGSSRPTAYDIRVVVYRNIELSEVARLYPVDEKKNIDFRYLTYSEAIPYLRDKITENIEPSVTRRLEDTLSLIEENL